MRVTEFTTPDNAMPLPDLHTFQILKFVHKFSHNQDQLPSVYSYYFNKNRIFHSYNTRTKDAVHSQSFRTSLGQRSITYKGAILWNDLSEKLKGIVSATKFSRKLKELHSHINWYMTWLMIFYCCFALDTCWLFFLQYRVCVCVCVCACVCYYAALLRRRGPHIASHSVCLSVCPSVRLSVRPSRSRK